jgi:hypothetical protein
VRDASGCGFGTCTHVPQGYATGRELAPVPITEDSPLRAERPTPAHGRCIADGIPHRAPGWTRIPWPQIALACPNGVNPAVGPDPASGADEQERGGDVVVLQRDRGFRVDTVRPRKVPARIAGMGVVAW